MNFVMEPTMRIKSQRNALRLSLNAAGRWIALPLLVLVSTGCQTVTSPKAFPPPPEQGIPQGFPADTTATPETSGNLSGGLPPVDYGTNGVSNVVRGQNSGFELPPLPTFNNATPATPASQNPSQKPAPTTTVAQKPQTGPAAPTSVTPLTTTAPNSNIPAEPYGISSTGPMATYGTQPQGYESLPELTSEQIYGEGTPLGESPVYVPNTRTADIYVNGYPARTGRMMFGGAVNSDAGVTGQITMEERNFDITRFPRSFQDLVSGTAFRGAGQTFRLEAMPGSRFKRYTVNFVQPFLFNYLPISMSVSGFLFDRRYDDWDEERLGGRLSFGYRITPDLSISAGLRGEQVEVSDPRVNTVAELNDVIGENDVYSWQLQLAHDTRNSPFAPSEGHYFETSYENVFGDYDFGRAEISYNKYFLISQRADRSGRQTLTAGVNFGFSGDDTPIFENFFAGGYSTLRGFEFRGASPTVNGVQVGGRFKMLGTVEYMFPLTADDMLRGVAFVDYGTIERDIEIHSDNFRVAPGFGLRVAVPALGPAPLAFDLAFPVAEADGDQKQTFSFSMGLSRRL